MRGNLVSSHKNLVLTNPSPLFPHSSLNLVCPKEGGDTMVSFLPCFSLYFFSPHNFFPELLNKVQQNPSAGQSPTPRESPRKLLHSNAALIK